MFSAHSFECLGPWRLKRLFVVYCKFDEFKYFFSFQTGEIGFVRAIFQGGRFEELKSITSAELSYSIFFNYLQTKFSCCLSYCFWYQLLCSEKITASRFDGSSIPLIPLLYQEFKTRNFLVFYWRAVSISFIFSIAFLACINSSLLNDGGCKDVHY